MLRVQVQRNPVSGEQASAWLSVAEEAALPGEPPRWDMHQAFEVTIVLAGRQETHFQGFVRELVPGDVALSPGWEPHGWRMLAPDTALLVIFFVPGFLGDERLEGLSWFSLFAAPAAQRPAVVSNAQRQRVLQIGAVLREEVDARETGWLTALRLGLLELLFTVSRRWTPSDPLYGRSHPGASDLARLGPALDLVAARRPGRVSLAQAAAACSLSPSRFAAIFRRTMGVSFGQFVLRSRLGHATELMVSSTEPIGRIAQAAGFTDPSHFHRAFVSCYGMTPGAYRAELGTR